MKYKVVLNIDQTVEEVTALFENPEHLKKWQPELVTRTHLEGEPGHPGSKSRLKYKIGQRDMEMIETITVYDLPTEYSATYQTDGVWNLQRNIFEKLGEKKTKWTTISEFKCSGFMRFICWLMPRSFRRQTFKNMRRFKAFAENNPEPDSALKK